MDLSEKDDRDRLYDHHKHNLIYIGDYIKFADTKAGVGLGAALVMLGFFGNEAKNIKFSSLSFWDYSLLVGLSPLIVTCYFYLESPLATLYNRYNFIYVMGWDWVISKYSSIR